MIDPIRDSLHRLAYQLPCRTIVGDDGSPYLFRFTLVDIPDGGKLYLHRFARSDEARELHNHPWRGRSLILAGGYVEERRVDEGVQRFVYRRGDVNIIEPNTFHRVDLIEQDCWTLFLVGSVEQRWGFWNRDTDEWMHWKEFLRCKRLVPS